MGRITSGVGLVSGINSKDIIDQLMTLEARPKDLIQKRIDSVNEQKLAYTDLSTRLTTMKLSAQSLKKPSFFEGSKATSSDEDVLTATASNGASVGSFQFQVARLVTAQQTVSQGFVDFDSTKVGAGTLTIEMGGGELSRQSTLGELNGGAGVRRGVFRITDRSGASTTIDITNAVTLDDVIKKVNTSLGIQVKAVAKGDGLVLTDLTGKTANNLVVQDIGDGHAAEDLGIVASSTTNTITGTDINYVGRSTNLSQLNDGRGIRTASSGNDLAIAVADGNGPTEISLAGKKTLGDVIDAINTAGGTKFKAEIEPGANGIKVTSLIGGDVTVTDVGTSKAGTDLGILGTKNTSITGTGIIAGLNTVLLSSLKGGAGLALGTISVQSRAASSGASIDLSGAKTVADVLDTINGANAGVKASLNGSGNGIQITDTSGGTGNIVIADVSGTGAASLGIAGTFDSNTPVVKGVNLQRAWMSENTMLAAMNGGKGVSQGKFKITAANGKTGIIDLTQGNEVRLQDVISEINTRQMGVTASINANGDGLLLTDTTSGPGKMKVEEEGGTTAADLNIKGTATDAGTINGTYEKTITVAATDTLQDVQKKINDLSFGVSASIINDGSGGAPYRLSLNSRNSGLAGRVVFDGGATKLDTHNLVEAQDAAVFVGSSDSTQPLLVTASRNQLAGVIKGVNVELHGVSDKPVNLSVSRSAENVTGEIQKFVDAFNEMADKMKELTKFDTATNTRGLLLGEVTIQTVQTTMVQSFQGVVTAGGRFRVLADVGVSFKDGKLEFDEDKFNEAYGTDPEAVRNLFSALQTGITTTTRLDLINNGAGVRRNADGSPDLQVSLKDGSKVNVALGGSTTIADVIKAINDAGAGKIEAKFGDADNLVITDKTTGTATYSVKPAGISQAIIDLGLNANAVNGVVTGKRLSLGDGKVANNAGLGLKIESAITKLIDPVNGVITRENKTLDARTTEFQDRIGSLDKLLTQKRDRLEKQFSNLESVLSGLQSQQTAIGQIQTIKSGK